MSEESKNGQETEQMAKRKLSGRAWVIVGAVAIVVAALVIGVAVYEFPSNRLARQLDLGQKYLEELDYEQAVVAFSQAIEIDPMNVDAYIGLAAAYEGLGDYETALAALDAGMQAAGEDKALKDALGDFLNAYSDVLMAEGKHDELRALSESYAEVEGVDFAAFLREIEVHEQTALLAENTAEEPEQAKTAEPESVTKPEQEESSPESTAEPEQTESILESVATKSEPEESNPKSAEEPEQEKPSAAVSGEAIVWQDPAFESAVREHLGKPEGDIYPSELEGITAISNFSMSGDVNRLLVDGRVYSLNDVKNFFFLESLEIERSGISDISALSGLTNLKELNLSENNINDIRVLSCLTNLKDLNLQRNNISDISALSCLTKLEHIDLSYNNISDISALRGLTNLEYFDLNGNNISDISVLSGLTNLWGLLLESNNISDVSALSGLTQLEWLYLSENNISDISVLGGLTNLEELLLNHNNISDVSALSGLTNLERLELSGNNISDINVLGGLTNLEYLFLFGNPIDDYSAVSFVPSLDY